MHVLSLLGSGGLAGADSPNGFVGEDDFAKFFSREVEEGLLDLFGDNLVVGAVLTLLQNLADAEDGGETFGKCEIYLLFEDFRGLAVILTTL